MGPASIVFPALDRFARQVREKCLLYLQVSKTEVFTWNDDLPAETPHGMKRAGVQEEVGGEWLNGFVCYGIPVGTTEYVKHMLGDKVAELQGEVNRVKEVLGEEDGQAIWCILKCSLAQKLDWHLSLCYPSDIRGAAQEIDLLLWNLLEYATKLHIPGRDESLGTECVLQVPEVSFLHGRSFQSLLIRQPVKLGGLGLRSMEETSKAAYIGGVEMSLPHFAGDGGICPLLADHVGRVEGGEGGRHS